MRAGAWTSAEAKATKYTTPSRRSTAKRVKRNVDPSSHQARMRGRSLNGISSVIAGIAYSHLPLFDECLNRRSSNDAPRRYLRVRRARRSHAPQDLEDAAQGIQDSRRD